MTLRLVLLFLVPLPLCGGQVERTPLIQTQLEVSESELLDVSILLFDPGLSPVDPYAKEDKGVFPSVRKAESRFIPIRLMETLQASGYWGAVRVVPPNFAGGEIRITGEIVKSSGFKQVVIIHATDATGKTFLKKRYKQLADVTAYRETEGVTDLPTEPYQFLYNRIANDLLAARRKLTPTHLLQIRQVNALRFAEDLAPTAFKGYLKTKQRPRNKRYKIAKLPAEDDPMLARVALIRERDAMLVDTLTTLYQEFGIRMEEVYKNWRKASYEEEKIMRKIRQEARNQAILGALLILGAVMTDGDSSAERGAQQVAVVAGSQLINQGMQRSADVKMQREALKELAVSLEGEVQPLLVELEGRTLELSGTAESRYAAWRQLLKAIFNEEMGLPVDPNTGEPVTKSGGAEQ